MQTKKHRFSQPKRCRFTIKKPTQATDSHRFNRVIGLGFEPRTHSLEGCCSIQLSYLTILIWWRKGRDFSFTYKFSRQFFQSLSFIYKNHEQANADKSKDPDAVKYFSR